MTQDPPATLITGAASGIGAALARRLAVAGARLLLHTRANAAALERLADTVRAAGGEAQTAFGALEDPDTAPALVAAAVAHFGRLDAVVANAGWADRTAALEMAPETVERAQAAIALGFVRLAQAAAPHVTAAAAGRLVAVSAFGPHVHRPGVPTFPATAAAKAALETHVRALAFELAGRGVTVNAVAPGFIAKDPGTHAAITEETRERIAGAIPMGRMGTPDEVAAVIGFLLSAEAGYVTGQVIHVNGGLV